jgi:ATP-dependent Clp protease protease subunit
VSAGLGIIDTIRFLRCDVATTCIGMAASMGAALLSAGTKGKRSVLPNAQIMLHQPLIGGVLQGPATDLGIEAQHMIRLRERLYKLMSQFTGKPADTIHRDFDRNKWLFAEEAVDYGVADRVLERAPDSMIRPHRADDNDEDDKD